MEIVPADNGNNAAVPLLQTSSDKTAPADSTTSSRTQKATPPPIDIVTLSTSETALHSLNKEKAPSIAVSREEMAALFESFAETFRFSIKA